MEKGQDIKQGPFRWLTVRFPANPDVEIFLEEPGPPVHDEATAAQLRELIAKGAMGSLVIHTDDARALYETLKARGVTDFTQEPTDHFYGTDMGIRDPFGNGIRVLQPAKPALRPTLTMADRAVDQANRDVVERFFAASERGVADEVASLVHVLAAMAAVEVKPEFAGQPRLVGSGSVWVLMAPLRYGDEVLEYVAVVQLEGGRIRHATGFWVRPLPGPRQRGRPTRTAARRRRRKSRRLGVLLTVFLRSSPRSAP